MKTCPTCGESYSPRIEFCFSDGEVLVDGPALVPGAVGMVDPMPARAGGGLTDEEDTFDEVSVDELSEPPRKRLLDFTPAPLEPISVARAGFQPAEPPVRPRDQPVGPTYSSALPSPPPAPMAQGKGAVPTTEGTAPWVIPAVGIALALALFTFGVLAGGAMPGAAVPPTPTPPALPAVEAPADPAGAAGLAPARAEDPLGDTDAPLDTDVDGPSVRPVYEASPDPSSPFYDPEHPDAVEATAPPTAVDEAAPAPRERSRRYPGGPPPTNP
jgi:hypothetical protein